MRHLFFILLFLDFILQDIQAQNQFTNGGFESNLDYWMYFSSIPSVTTFSLITDSVHGGTKSLKIKSVDSSGVMAAIAEEIAVSPGKSYVYNYWVNSDNVEQYVMPFLQFKIDTVKLQQSYCLPYSALNGWTKFTNRFTIPDNCNKVVLAMFCFGKGEFYFDDFSLVKQTDTTHHNFNVYTSQTKAPFKKILQVNNGPGDRSAPNNNIRQFQELGCDYVRTHDYFFAFDHHAIFPDTSRSPFDSLAYHFRTTDSIVKAILDAGGKVYYRLGESYETVPLYNYPPSDMEKWAQVCVQIIKHYNDGWKSGYHFGLDYFEIWNEPDIAQFWNGTPAQYSRLYSIASRKIKAYNPLLKIGGPAVSNIFNERFMNTFLDSVSLHHLPLDFLSYHVYYYLNPWYFKYANDYIRLKLESKGLNGIELINSEWNIYLYDFDVYSMRVCNDAINSASTLSAFKYMNETEIGKFFRYNLASYYFGLLNDDGSLRYGGLAYRIYRQLTDMTYSLDSDGDDSLGTTVMAARSLNGDMMQVVVSDNSSSSNGYHLNMNEIPALTGSSVPYYDYEIYRIDFDNMYFRVASGTVDMLHPFIAQSVHSPFTDHIIFYQRLGVSESDDISFVSAYPNPFSERIVIRFSGNVRSIEIFDLTGNKLLEKQLAGSNPKPAIFEWDGRSDEGADLPKGIYFLKVSGNDRLPLYVKLVKS